MRPGRQKGPQSQKDILNFHLSELESHIMDYNVCRQMLRQARGSENHTRKCARRNPHRKIHLRICVNLSGKVWGLVNERVNVQKGKRR